jgi:hypothetical protein
MIYISHRGNIDGSSLTENYPIHITNALALGYDVEIDVWLVNNKLYLGHDGPNFKTEVQLSYLKNKKFWCHAKNVEALELMLKNDIHCFWHQEDDVTITSRGYIWTYPGKKLATSQAIAVLPELFLEWDTTSAVGICSDYIDTIYLKNNND